MRHRTATAFIGLAAAFAMAAPSNALALTHYWGPRLDNSYIAHYDVDTSFHSWAGIIAGTMDPWYNSMAVWEVCAKAVTQAGNIRTGSGCNYGVADRGSILSGPTPYSRGYVYYGNNIAAYISGRSDT